MKAAGEFSAFKFNSIKSYGRQMSVEINAVLCILL